MCNTNSRHFHLQLRNRQREGHKMLETLSQVIPFILLTPPRLKQIIHFDLQAAMGMFGLRWSGLSCEIREQPCYHLIRYSLDIMTGEHD